MVERLEDAVLASKTSPKYSTLVKEFLDYDNFFILKEIQRINANVKKLRFEKIMAFFQLNSESNTAESDEKKENIARIIAMYLIFDSKKQDLISLRYYLYSIIFLSKYFLRKYVKNIKEIESRLSNFFFHESRKILYILKEKVLLNTDIIFEEKNEMLDFFRSWIECNQNFPLINKQSIFTIIIQLKSILSSIDQFKKRLSDENKVKKYLTSTLLKNTINNIFSNNLIDSKRCYQLLESFINTSSLESNKKDLILNTIQAATIEFQFPVGSSMIEYAEKMMPNFFSFKFINNSKIEQYIKEFFKKNHDLIDKYHSIYLETKTSEEVNPDIILVNFLVNFMSCYEELHPLILKDFRQKQEFINYFSLKALVLNILKLEKEHQCIVIEVFNRELISYTYETYNEILKKFILEIPDIVELSQKLKEDFRTRAAFHPFRTILAQFLPNQNLNFEECINQIAKKTFTMTITSKTSGLTIFSRAVVLRRCEDNTHEKAGSFYVWLQEVANYLQRIIVNFIGEVDRALNKDTDIKLNLDEDSSENFGEFSNEKALQKIYNFASLRKNKISKEVKRKNNTEDEKKEEKNYDNIMKADDEERIDKEEVKDDGERIDKEKVKDDKERIDKDDEERIDREVVKDNEEKKEAGFDECKVTRDIFSKNIEKKKRVFELQTKNLPGVEGGKILEYALFGRQYETMYSGGAEFLLSDLSRLSLPKFRKLFNEKNIRIDNEAGYSLSSGDFIRLGICPGYPYSIQFIIN